jgi:hypothetical protein
VRRQLAADPELRARLAQIEAPAILRPLPEALPRRRLSAWWSAPVVVALACVLWVMRPGPVDPPMAGIKGSTPSVAVVARRGAELLVDVEAFAPMDRLKLQLTCAPQQSVDVDVVIFQDGVDFLHAAPRTIRCGNAVAIPGAFRLDENLPAQVCVLIDAPPSLRERLKVDGLAGVPAGTPCRALAPLP